MAGPERSVTLKIREVREGRAFAEAADDADKAGKSFQHMQKDSESLQKEIRQTESDVGKSFQNMRKDSESLQKELTQTESKTKKLGTEFAKSSNDAGRAGKSYSDMSRDTADLRKEIDFTEEKLKNLNTEFAKSGDRTLFKDIGKERRSASQMRKILSELEADFGDGGGESGHGFIRNAIAAIKDDAPSLIAVISAVAVAALPGIGALAAGAFTGGAIATGMAAGILSATKDSRVVSAMHEFKETISKTFFQGTAFVEPIRNSLKILEDAFSRLNLAEAFAKVAPFVERVAEGLGEMALHIMPGLNAAFDRAGPFAEALADGFVEIGTAIGSFLQEVSSSDGAIIALRTTFDTLGEAIIGTGKLLNVLSDIFAFSQRRFTNLADVLSYFPGPIGSLFRDLAGKMHDVIDVSAPTASAIKSVGAAASQSSAELKSMRTAAIQLARGSFSLEAAQDDAANAVANLRHQVEEQRSAHVKGAAALRGNTQAARDNRASVRGLVASYAGLIDQTISAGHSADGLKNQLQNQLTKMGFARSEASRYVNQLVALRNSLSSIHSKEVNIWVRQHYSTSGTALGEHSGLRINETQGRAAGGPVVAGVPYRINERGMETVTFPAGGRVHPANLTPVMSGNTYNISVTLGPVGNLRDVGSSIVEAIRSYERSNGTRWRTA